MPSLGYWKIRGLAQPIRLMLTYAGEEFEDVQYEQGEGPEFSREAWTSVKNNLGLPFPNLPYFIDGDIKLTQSNSIIRYIAKKNNLLGKTPQEQVNCDVMLENAMDFRNGMIRVVYNQNYESVKQEYFDKVKPMLETFEKFLADKPFFAGSEVTACDFPMYELLDQHTIMKSDILKSYPKLTDFHKRFATLPKIKEYLGTDKCKNLPINNKSAGFK